LSGSFRNFLTHLGTGADVVLGNWAGWMLVITGAGGFVFVFMLLIFYAKTPPGYRQGLVLLFLFIERTFVLQSLPR